MPWLRDCARSRSIHPGTQPIMFKMFGLNEKMCFFFSLSDVALAYGACFAWRKRDATKTKLTQAILSTNLPDSVKVSLCHVDFGSKELPKWIHSDWKCRADYLQHHPANQSLHLTSAWHIAHHGGEPNNVKGAILNNSSLYSAMF